MYFEIAIMLFSLDPMNWLHPTDRMLLYSSGICNVTIIKASLATDIKAAASAQRYNSYITINQGFFDFEYLTTPTPQPHFLVQLKHILEAKSADLSQLSQSVGNLA